jgi:aerobic carbon-monoxide dehydrogenase medium subunit
MSVPAIFDYHPATTIDEAIALLQQYGDDAKVLAGGHSLLPAMKLRLAQPEHLIDIGKIPGLSYIREENGVIAIGALTTHTQIEQSDLLRQRFPILPEGASEVGDQQVRNRGTIGGSVSHADPAGDLPAIVLALKGEMVVRGANGSRTIKADDFFIGMYTTALKPDEILTELRFAIPSAATGSAYLKLPNKASHYAVTGCAAVISHDDAGICTAASIAITGASVQPTRASAAESALLGKQLNESTIAEAANHVVDGLEIVSDIHGSEEYRRQMTIVIARRTLLHAWERA